MERHLDDTPGLALDRFRPGVRGENKALRNFVVRCYGCVYARSNDGMCNFGCVSEWDGYVERKREGGEGVQCLGEVETEDE